MTKRLCILVHFDRHDLVDEYVYYYLSSLSSLMSDIVFVSTSDLDLKDVERLSKSCCKTIVRENVGHDFSSWRAGLNALANAFEYDEVVLCNDSVYGPFFPLGDLFKRMEETECDFWGVTENVAIAYHLQSYFLVFRKSVVRSSVFKEFWDRLYAEKDKEAVITKYEVGLTQNLMACGYKPSVYAPARFPIFLSLQRQVLSKVRRKKSPVNLLLKFVVNNASFRRKGINPTHFFWKELIRDYQVPFVKVELLRDNPRRVDVRDFDTFLQGQSAYPIDLIKNHLVRVGGTSNCMQQ